MTTEIWPPAEAPPEALEWGPVRLDRWRPEDLEDQYAAVDLSRDHLAPFMPWSHGYEPAGSEWFLADSARAWGDRTAFNYRVSAADLVPGRVLGSAGLMARGGPGMLEIGYWVRSDAVRRGIAWRAAAALTEAGLALPGVERIEIHHHPLNEASAGIPAKLRYARLPEHVPGPPGFEHLPMVCWVVGQKDWVPVRG